MVGFISVPVIFPAVRFDIRGCGCGSVSGCGYGKESVTR
jgi:hypothetical protein